eukprot:768384-Hanusia_phi.AAC.8
MDSSKMSSTIFGSMLNGAGEKKGTDNGRGLMKRMKTIKKEKTAHLFTSSKNLTPHEETGYDPENIVEEEEEQGRTAKFYPDFPWGVEGVAGHKSSVVLIVIDIFVVLSCLYVAGTVPYVVGFAGVIKNSRRCIFSCSDPETRWLAGLDVITDLVFCCDIVIHFYTARWVLVSDGLQVMKELKLRHALLTMSPALGPRG